MEFENLSSSEKAIYGLKRLLGLQKVSPRASKDPAQVVILSLRKVYRLHRKVAKNLKNLLGDSTLVPEYLVAVAQLTSISERIITKLGGN